MNFTENEPSVTLANALPNITILSLHMVEVNIYYQGHREIDVIGGQK